MAISVESNEKPFNVVVSLNVRLGFAALVSLLIVSAGISAYNTRRLYEESTGLSASHAIQEALALVLSTMKDIETGQRGYAITGDKRFLDPYQQGLRDIQAQTDRLRTLLADQGTEDRGLDAVEKKIAERLALAKQNIDIADKKGLKAAQDFLAQLRGKRVMDELRALIGAIYANEDETQRRAEQQFTRSYYIAMTANLLIVLLGLGLVAVAFRQVRRELAAHQVTAAQLFEQRERLQVTLTSIGDAVIVTDENGIVTFLNPVAGALTGWTQDGIGQNLSTVFHIIDEASRRLSESPVDKVLREGNVVGLANHTLLIARDSREIPIDDSGAPIRNQDGKIVGVVLVFRDITERKLAEDALRQREQELGDFFENASVGLHLVGPDGVVLRVNQAELDMLGYARDEFVGRSIADFHADSEAIDDILCRLTSGEIVTDYEARLRCKDGSIKVVLINSSALWVNGKFIHSRCFTRDITARKRAEESLRASEFRYRRLFETARNAILILDGDSGDIIDANPNFTELMGYERSELTGKQLWEIGIFENALANKAALRQIRQQGTVRYDPLSMTTLAGERAETECYAVAYAMDQKAFVQFNIHDITGRVRAEEALRAAGDRFRSVVDHIIHGVISIDESGVIESVNPAAERLFGYAAVELIGTNVKLLMPEPYHSEHDSYLWNYMETGHAKIIGIGRDVVGLRRDGSTFPMELAVSTFPLGQRRLFTGIVQDISERKRMEGELRERVAQLRDADHRKNEFLAMLAHELRNPLAPVLNAVHLLRKNCPTDPETIWAHDVIERQVQHMTRMVDDLLDVSRITRGLINLQKSTIDIATVVNRALEMTQPLIDARKHQLTRSLPEEPIYVEGDLPRLAQVLANLLHNAAKYTEDGGTIWLTVEKQGNDVVIKVRDTGIGIPADYLPRVFDLFSQEDSSLERTYGGLGIGLTLVRVLVKMHAGTIQAFSKGIGHGSEFVLTLPAGSAPVLRADSPDSSMAPPLSAPKRILVVDDNVDGARSLSLLLRQDGHEVFTVNDGLAALELARTTPIDVVLLDIGMPHMSGLEVARRMRNDLGLTNVLLVAMTGYGQDDDRQRSVAAGFNAHMVKPLDLDALQILLTQGAALKDSSR